MVGTAIADEHVHDPVLVRCDAELAPVAAKTNLDVTQTAPVALLWNMVAVHQASLIRSRRCCVSCSTVVAGATYEIMPPLVYAPGVFRVFVRRRFGSRRLFAFIGSSLVAAEVEVGSNTSPDWPCLATSPIQSCSWASHNCREDTPVAPLDSVLALCHVPLLVAPSARSLDVILDAEWVVSGWTGEPWSACSRRWCLTPVHEPTSVLLERVKVSRASCWSCW